MFIDETRLKCIIKEVIISVIKEQAKGTDSYYRSLLGGDYEWISGRELRQLRQMKDQLHVENNRFLDEAKADRREIAKLQKERDELRADLTVAAARIESLRALVHGEK